MHDHLSNKAHPLRRERKTASAARSRYGEEFGNRRGPLEPGSRRRMFLRPDDIAGAHTMLVLESVTHYRPDKKAVLRDVSAMIPSDRRLIIFSHDQKNRIYFLYLLAGIVFPLRGKVHRLANFSFPIGFHAALEYDLSLRENAIIIAKFYNVHIRDMVNFMRGFPIVEREFDVRLERLSPRAKLLAAYLFAYCIPFDCYLMDRAVARGDPEVREIVTSLFEARARTAGVILTTANTEAARTHFEIGGILHRGQLKLYDSVQEASAVFGCIPAIAEGRDEEKLLEL